jgi:hypothetical protein
MSAIVPAFGIEWSGNATSALDQGGVDAPTDTCGSPIIDPAQKLPSGNVLWTVASGRLRFIRATGKYTCNLPSAFSFQFHGC